MAAASFGVMLHNFIDARHAAVPGAITADQFRQIIARIGRENILGANEWLEEFRSTGRQPTKTVLTFDDALLSQYDVALPILREQGLDAFWFVYTAPLQGERPPLEVYRFFRSLAFDDFEGFFSGFLRACEAAGYGDAIRAARADFVARRYLADYAFYSEHDRWFRYIRDVLLKEANYDVVMLRLMKDMDFSVDEIADSLWINDAQARALHEEGHILGLHSHTHPIRIEDGDYDMQKREYSANALHLQRIMDRPATVMAHPTNSYNDDTLSILRDMGVEVGFRANNVLDTYSVLEIPRIDHTSLLEPGA